MNNQVHMLAINNSINVIMLCLLIYMVVHNTILSSNKVRAYAVAAGLTVTVMMAEILSHVIPLLGPGFYRIIILVDIIGFSLSPFIPLALADIFHQTGLSKKRYLFLPAIINVVFVVSSPWTGFIFHHTADYDYERGPFFGIYVASYLFTLLVLIVANARQLHHFQGTEKVFITMLYLILVAGTTIQILFPDVYTTWHCVSLVLIMYYLYQREIQYRYDVLTRLMNRTAFEKRMERMEKAGHGGIVLADVDDFKEINDRYGHGVGDHCLSLVAGLMAESFQDIGQCFRIGGDEFCVLTKTANGESIKKCLNEMQRLLDEGRKKDPVIPYVSYGFSIYSKRADKEIRQVFEAADKAMYACKKERKRKTAER